MKAPTRGKKDDSSLLCFYRRRLFCAISTFISLQQQSQDKDESLGQRLNILVAANSQKSQTCAHFSGFVPRFYLLDRDFVKTGGPAGVSRTDNSFRGSLNTLILTFYPTLQRNLNQRLTKINNNLFGTIGDHCVVQLCDNNYNNNFNQMAMIYF